MPRSPVHLQFYFERLNLVVHYVGKFLDGTVFDSSRERGHPLKFQVGLEQVVKGWDKCVATMNIGEKVKLTCKPEYAYGVDGCPPEIPPNTTIVFEDMELLNFKKPIETTDDRVEETIRLKTEGNELFKQEKYSEAIRLYEKSMDVWKFIFPREEEDKKKMQDAQLPVLLNMAACQIKLKDYKSAWLSCEKALDIDVKNVKAIFRRGQSYAGQGDFEKARQDMIAAIKLDPKNKDIRAAYEDLKKQELDYKKKQQAMYSKMGSMFG